MNNEFFDVLKTSLDNPEGLNLEQVQKLALEADKYLSQLETSLQSKSPKEKETAVTSAEEIRQFLEGKASQFASYIENGLTDEEKTVLSEIN